MSSNSTAIDDDAVEVTEITVAESGNSGENDSLEPEWLVWLLSIFIVVPFIPLGLILYRCCVKDGGGAWTKVAPSEILAEIEAVEAGASAAVTGQEQGVMTTAEAEAGIPMHVDQVL